MRTSKFEGKFKAKVINSGAINLKNPLLSGGFSAVIERVNGNREEPEDCEYDTPPF